MRRLLVAVGVLVMASWAGADDFGALYQQMRSVSWDAMGPLAQTIIERVPVSEDSPREYNTVQRYGEVYWRASDLALKEGKARQALEWCRSYMKVYPAFNAPMHAQVGETWGRAAVAAKLDAGEGVAEAQGLLKFMREEPQLTPRSEVAWCVMQLYEQAGQIEEVRRLAEELPYERPDLVESAAYWNGRVRQLLMAGDMAKAKQAALAAYRLAPVTDKPDKDESLKLLLRVLAVTDGPEVTTAFLTFLQTGEGVSPLAGVGPLTPTEEQRAKQRVAVGASLALAVDAFLLNGEYAEAMHAAQAQAMMEGADASAGLNNAARCFKAKDLHCLRAQQYIEWVKSGAGTNPLPEF